MLRQATSQILKNTLPTRQHLTPELLLRLITPDTPLWKAGADQLPFKDPYWAFYWPGGQATARYILDNADLFKSRSILDLGCGCGAGSIAAMKSGAKNVVANDIDMYAAIATKMNAKLNAINHIKTCTDDLIGSKCEEYDTILIGDMFYDEEFAKILFDWLHELVLDGKSVLIGDPGRHGLTEKRRSMLTSLAQYKLNEHSSMENNGFTHCSVWRLNK